MLGISGVRGSGPARAVAEHDFQVEARVVEEAVREPKEILNPEPDISGSIFRVSGSGFRI